MVNDTGSFEKLRILVRSTQLYQLEQALGSKREEMALHVRIVIAPALVRNEISPSLRKLSVVELFGDVLAGLMFLFLFLSWLWFRR